VNCKQFNIANKRHYKRIIHKSEPGARTAISSRENMLDRNNKRTIRNKFMSAQ